MRLIIGIVLGFLLCGPAWSAPGCGGSLDDNTDVVTRWNECRMFGLATPPSDSTCGTAVAFSPKGNAESVLLTVLSWSRESLYVAIYGLTNMRIVDALILAKERGVTVSVKVDRLQSAGKASAIQARIVAKLKAAGVSVMVSKSSATMHDKYLIMDGEVVVTGSYNWTGNAEKNNRENLVVLTCPWLAKEFKANWDTIK